MKSRTSLLAIIGAVVFGLAAALMVRSAVSEGEEDVVPEAQAPAGPISQLSWLAGCWAQQGSGYRRDEQWMEPLGGTMIGMSRTVAGDETVEFESIRIETREDGLAYVALPSGQAEATFMQSELTDSTAVFEDPAHDFPQRIAYARQGRDAVMAWIEGDVDGVTQVIEFPLTRTSCP